MNDTSQISVIALLAFVVGCSPPADDPTPDTDGGVVDSATNVPRDLPELDEGIYAGNATNDANVSGTLGLWEAPAGHAGRLVIDGTDAYAVELAEDRRVITPLDGACDGCPQGEWALRVERDGTELTLALTDPSREIKPGFDGLVMVPHDGFKPERGPSEDVDLYFGPVLAVDPSVSSMVTLDADCEIAVAKDGGGVQSLGCLETPSDNPWTNLVETSWSVDSDRASFVVDTGDARFGWIGTQSGSGDDKHFEGRIHRLGSDEEPHDSAPVIGRFDLTTLP